MEWWQLNGGVWKTPGQPWGNRKGRVCSSEQRVDRLSGEGQGSETDPGAGLSGRINPQRMKKLLFNLENTQVQLITGWMA